MPGALLFFIFCIATMIHCQFGGSPSSWAMVVCSLVSEFGISSFSIGLVVRFLGPISEEHAKQHSSYDSVNQSGLF